MQHAPVAVERSTIESGRRCTEEGTELVHCVEGSEGESSYPPAHSNPRRIFIFVTVGIVLRLQKHELVVLPPRVGYLLLRRFLRHLVLWAALVCLPTHQRLLACLCSYSPVALQLKRNALC
jgi:hypothetical protein